MTRFCVAMALLCVAAPAYAQHPCDLAVPSSYVLNPGDRVAVGFCHSGTDDQGNPVTDFQVVLPDRTVSLGIPVKLTALANGAGLFLYESPAMVLTAEGNVSVRAVNGTATSLLSTPIAVTFTVTLPPVPVSSLPSPSGVRFWRQ